MKKYLMSAAIGDLVGSPYVGKSHRIKLAISLGGDADTLTAIAGLMAYAYYKKMPDALVYQAMKMLPDRMVKVSERFDKVVNSYKEG